MGVGKVDKQTAACSVSSPAKRGDERNLRVIFVNESDVSVGGFGPTVLTMGNFDGVHLGHRALFERITARAAKLGVKSAVYTLHPHPKSVLGMKGGPKLICTFEEKVRLVEEAGVDIFAWSEFTPEFGAVPHDRFVKEILVEKFQVREVHVGYDNQFGRNREGNFGTLKLDGEKHGFDVFQIDPVVKDGHVISSKLIRRLIGEGDVRTASRLLGRRFHLDGLVVAGDHRGKGMGFPTANISSETELTPKKGVYATFVDMEGEMLPAVTNVGTNPTFKGTAGSLRIETFILDLNADLYGKEMRLKFVERLRAERTFPSVEELKAQIGRDVEKAKTILAAEIALKKTGAAV